MLTPLLDLQNRGHDVWAHTMAIDSNNVLWGWGSNDFGQLGDGTTTNRLSPVRIMDNVVHVSAGGMHTVAITTDGTLWAWGSGGNGPLGDGTRENRHRPVAVMQNVVYACAGPARTLAITADGELWGWGASNDQINAFPRYVDPWGMGILGGPTRVMHIESNIVSVSNGAYHVAALNSNGEVLTWGHNRFGQLGRGNMSNAALRRPEVAERNAAQVSAGGWHTYVLRPNGDMVSFGHAGDGRRGPHAVTGVRQSYSLGSVHVVQVSAGRFHNLALMSDGSIRAWGVNTAGQLGGFASIH